MGEPLESAATSVHTAPASVPDVADQDAGAAVPMESDIRELFNRGKNGAAWFFWIAVLSGINTIMVLSAGGVTFALGLAVTMISDNIAAHVALKPGGNLTVLIIALVFDAIVLGSLVLCGRLAQRRLLAVFAAGMALYLLDGLISLLLLQNMVSVAIHGFALWGMWSGFSAYRQLNALESRLLSARASGAGGV
jgi:hypothetical protein